MKFNIPKNKQKVIQITLSLMLITFALASKNKITDKSMGPIIIENQLDLLINKLENREQLSNSSNVLNETNMEKPEIRKKSHLQDEVVNALNDLNKDFIEYDMILSKEKGHKISMKNQRVFSSNETHKFPKENLTRVRESNFSVVTYDKKPAADLTKKEKEDNVIIDSSKNYLNEVNSLTTNIDESLNTFDEIDGYNKEKEKVLKKINDINSIRENVNNLKGEIDAIKNDKKILKEKISSIKNISHKLLKQYNNYLEIQGNKDKRIKDDLRDIKKDMEKSIQFNRNVDEFIQIFGKIINFRDRIDTEKVEDLIKKQEKFSGLIKKFDKKDAFNSNLM